ncbi:mucin-2-like [Saccostrea cucullata]|uniref:mucin-2-like n=1 Tax=Saccostrea cuccullata TaxID=36930 RepID=UPI002ED0AFD4
MDTKDPGQEINTKDEVPGKAKREEELVSRLEKGQGEKKGASQSKETQDDGEEKTDDSDFDQDVCRLLRKIGEGTLISLFVKERVTIEILMDLNHADLRELGVGTFGQRHKILKAIKEYREKEKKQKKTLCKLHPFNTTCPGRKRKSHNQTSYGHHCKITKKMKAKIPKELPVVTSTASSIQPSASVITTASSSCDTAVTQSCHTLNVSSTTSPLHNNRSSITVPTTLSTTNLAITTHGTTSTVTTTKMPKTTHGATVPTSNIATTTNASTSTLPINNIPVITNGTSTVPITSMTITTHGTTSTITSTQTAITTRGSTSTVPTTKLTSIIGTLPTAFPAKSSTLSSSSVATPICSAATFSQVTSSSSNQVPIFGVLPSQVL